MNTEEKPHNPDNLTTEQVGTAQGWRLLDEDELAKTDITFLLAEIDRLKAENIRLTEELEILREGSNPPLSLPSLSRREHP